VKDAIGRARRRRDFGEVRRLRQQQRALPRGNPRDPGYRRLWYTRYADDHLLGFIGPRQEAEQIKARLAKFLREDLKLELNQDKMGVPVRRDSSATRSPSSTPTTRPPTVAGRSTGRSPYAFPGT
jgi:hypothetical protein